MGTSSDCVRRLFASEQTPTGKILGGEANASTVVVPGLRSGTSSISLGQVFM